MINSDHFRDARILYFDISPNYYPLSIKKSIEKQGGTVDFFAFENDSFLSKLYRNTNKTIWLKHQHILFKSWLSKIKSKNYDYLLIKAPFKAPLSLIEEISNTFSAIRRINYNWSSVAMFDFLPYQHFFDRVISFDPDDCKAYNLEYYPLFFTDDYKNARSEILQHDKDIDVLFVGSAYSKGRFKFIKNVEKYCENNGLTYFFYLFQNLSKIEHLKRIVKRTNILDVKSKFLSHAEIIDLFKRSKVIIDHPMEIQSGLTMRTFETLGAGLKLITTNKNIINEPFYDKDTISITTNQANFDISFLTVYNSKFNEKIDNYHIDKWTQHILGATN
jgi:hypothetical protein